MEGRGEKERKEGRKEREGRGRRRTRKFGRMGWYIEEGEESV